MIKDTSINAIKIMNKMKLEVIMLTGDTKETANVVANKVGITNIVAEVLPCDKEKTISNLQKQGKKVLMVGDGINDAPALAKADVGIAIGKGTDIAIDSADMVLIKNDLMDVVNAIRLSHKTIINIKENLFWAFAYNVILIPLAAGMLYNNFNIKVNPMLCALAMSLSSFCVVTNALRIRNVKLLENKKEKLMNKIIKIEGMMCNHCVDHVTEALNNIENVKVIEVNLKDKKAIVEVNSVNDDILKEAIVQAGYTVIEIK